MPPTPGLIRAVQATKELYRVIAIPRRTWTDESATALAAELTALLRKSGGTMGLRPIQAQALLEAGTEGGGFYPIRVGGGKTLISGLAPYVLDARRPLLILPAKLISKTKREFRVLCQHWQIPNFIRFLSYELLGRVQSQTELDRLQPDLVILDEAHKAKNKKAACTKRIHRYITTHPGTKVIAMSGTITKRSLKDFAHIIAWCLRANILPLPHSYTELEDWADAIDEKKKKAGEEMGRIGLGALTLFQSPEERADPDQLNATRRAYGRRLVDTTGVVASRDKGPDCSLTIEALWGDKEIILTPAVDQAFEVLRKTWKAPDGWPLADPMSVWRVLRELSLGFYNVWDPRPPQPWADARKCWAAWCRDILTNNRRQLDSELQVTNAVEDGHYPQAKPALLEWRKVKDSFEPNSIPVWLDYTVVKAAAAWAQESPGIVWCEHVPFAKELAKRASLAYYGKRGRDARGREIEDHPPDESLIASVASSGEGRNLQAWNRNLITSWPANGMQVEQLMGRTHRDDQKADEVTFDAVVTSLSHIEAFEQSLRDARRIEAQMPGQPQKLLYADRLFPEPSDVQNRTGYRWIKP